MSFNLEKTTKILRFLGIILLTIATGLFLVNQLTSFVYKAKFIESPCNLCKELNEEYSECIDKCFFVNTTLYPVGDGEWSDVLNQKEINIIS